MSKRVLILMCSIFLVVPLLFMGCSGDDGATGATGATGPAGPPGSSGSPGDNAVTSANPETCNTCHSSVSDTHALDNIVVSGITTTKQADNTLLIRFNVKVNGFNSSDFDKLTSNDNVAGVVNWDNVARKIADNTLITSFQRDNIAQAPFAYLGAGMYTITIPAASVIDNSTYAFRLSSPAYPFRPMVVATYGAQHLRNLVTNTGCASCHGPYPAESKVAEGWHHYAVGGSECQICHSRYDRTVEVYNRKSDGTFDNAIVTGRGTNLVEYVHGIHNSHNRPDGTYYRTTTPGPENWYSIGYPSDMRNCKTCHTTQAQLDNVATAPVSYYLCMTCHQNWDGFKHVHDAPGAAAGSPIFEPSDFHRPFDNTTNCATQCHNALVGLNEVYEFHNDFQSTDSHYDSFYRGTDISYDNPDNVLFKVTGVTKSGDNVTFTWTASKNGAAVNPCDNNLATGPNFRGLGAYLAYAKGDDWVNDNVVSSSSSPAPGQPLSARNLFTSLSTTCASNVATTTGLRVAPNTGYAKKAALAIGGKPVNRGTSFLINNVATTQDYFVRSTSQVYAFNMTDGSAATPRRGAVDSAKCNGCHQGTLYQHGGDRVDNEQMCAICHNPSASDKNNRIIWRVVNSDNTVDTTSTYDGKVAETYDMRYLIHSIHGAEKRGDSPIVIYRTRGIFAFAGPDAVKPTGWPADNQTIFGSDNNSKIAHTWTLIHYPRPMNECTACHFDSPPGQKDPFEAPDQTKAVALTIDPGTSFPVQADDIVIGPGAAACTACHATTSFVHATTPPMGYKANVTKESMVDLATQTAAPDVTP